LDKQIRALALQRQGVEVDGQRMLPHQAQLRAAIGNPLDELEAWFPSSRRAQAQPLMGAEPDPAHEATAALESLSGANLAEGEAVGLPSEQRKGSQGSEAEPEPQT